MRSEIQNLIRAIEGSDSEKIIANISDLHLQETVFYDIEKLPLPVLDKIRDELDKRLRNIDERRDPLTAELKTLNQRRKPLQHAANRLAYHYGQTQSEDE